MGWFARLFGVSRDNGSAKKPATDADLNTRVARPRKTGRSKEEQKADWDAYCKKMQAKFKAASERDRRNSLKAGAKRYVWRSCGDEDVCPTCAKRDGKKFSWSSPPSGGHPGESDSCPSGWCRCYAEPIL